MRNTKGLKAAVIAAVAIILAIVAGSFIAKTIKNANLSPEMKRTMQYETFSNDFDKVDNCDYVRFGAYFAQDLDGDGYAEKIAGSCKNVKQTNTMFIDLSVVENGYLEDGKITINGTNMTYAMQVVQDSMLDGNYISDNVRQIKFRNVNAGNNEFLSGVVKAKISGQNDYSKQVTVTLTGTHVSDPDPENDGAITRTPISKTMTLDIDWYGESYASALGEYKKLYLEDYCKSFIERVGEYDESVERPLTFTVTTKDTKKELLTISNVMTVEIPEMYGYYPTSVTAPNGVYDSNTHILTITNNEPAYNQTVEVTCIYPQAAYNLLEPGDSFSAPVTSYYTCHNNPNEEFDNPYVSNTATAVANFYFEIYTPADDPWGIRITTSILDKVRMDSDYFITKQNLIDAYLLENEDDIRNVEYKVVWNVSLKTDKEPHDYIVHVSDEHESGDLINGQPMNDYISTTGIYFRQDGLLPRNDVLKIYNDETNELVKEFTYDEVRQYTETNPYYFENSVPRIRAEITSSDYMIDREYKMDITTIREIDSKKVKQDFTKDEAVDFGELHTRCRAYITTDGTDSAAMVDDDNAKLETERNYVELSVSTNSINTTEIDPVRKNISIYIPKAKSGIYRDWVDGQFLIKVPKKIKYFKINNVTSTNNDVQIDAYDLYVFHGNYFIEVITSNTTPTSGIRINVDCEMLADPMTSADTVDFELYAFNEDFNIYYNSKPDIYDVNGNEDTTELIGYDTAAMQIFVPTSFTTVQTVSNYNDDNETTIAPNIAEVTTARRTATMNVQFINNYGTPVDNIRILGKVPSEGNTYVGGGDLHSEFDVYMTNDGITVPTSLTEYAHVYYSEVENPTDDLDNAANGWKTADQTNFANVKSYLIVLENYTAESGVPYTFSYNVSIPSGVDVNSVTYGCHKMFFDLYLDGESGKLEREINPNKVGLRVANYYNLDITKLKEGLTRGVQGAKYKIEEVNTVATVNELNKVLTSTAQGHIELSDLRVNQLYRFYEIKAPDAYELNEDVILFKVVPGANDTLSIVYESDATFGPSATISQQGGINTLTANIYDTPKVGITLTKVDAVTNEPIDDVRFSIDGKTYITKNGVINVEGLSLNHEYTVKETYANGYFLAPEFTFTVNKDSSNNITITSTNSTFANATISNTNNEDLVGISLEFPNYQIEKYQLKIQKVSESDENRGLSSAKFLLTRDDLDNADFMTTDGAGIATMNGLYVFEDGRGITGRYSLVEEEAPNGYVLNKEEIAFVVSKELNPETDLMELVVNVENANDLVTYAGSEIDQANKIVTIKIKDKPLFKLTKTDVDTGLPLENVGFVIYELNEDGEIVDYAKDPNGDYIGTRDSQRRYIVYTDANGELVMPLSDGVYKIMEVEFLEGYKQVDNSEVFRVNGNNTTDHYTDVEFPEVDSTEPTREITRTITINSIEDWIDFAQDVNSGTDYSTTKVLLERSLDFNEDSSYDDPTVNTYGDINNDGIEGATIKEELTDANGKGCISVGKSSGPFKGVFDGQNKELKNFYSNSKASCGGVFGCINGAVIKNLTVGGIETFGYWGGFIGYAGGNASYLKNLTGKINFDNATNYNQTGGIVGYSSAELMIVDCKNHSDLQPTGNVGMNQVGGILGQATKKVTMVGCVNYGEISGTSSQYLGGLIGFSNNEVIIIDSHNEGKIESTTIGAGLCGKVSSVKIKNSYNIGDIESGSNGGGLVGEASTVLITDSYNQGSFFDKDYPRYGGIIGYGGSGKITNCHNEGAINADNGSSGYYVGGIAGEFSGDIINCHNSATINSNYGWACGICGRQNGSGKTQYCYNTGSINGTGNGCYIAGIAYGTSNSSIEDCFNLGNLTSDNSSNTVNISGISLSTSTVKNCYNKGTIKVQNTSRYVYAGGIDGFEDSSTIINCYNNGKIELKDINAGVYARGIGGMNVDQCYNTGDIEAKNVKTANISGVSKIGRLTNSYNTGKISFEGNSNSSDTAEIRIGGVSEGYNYSSDSERNIEYCYNTGDIKVVVPDMQGSLTNLNISVGGILGDASNYSVPSPVQYIRHSYNTGDIEIIDPNDVNHKTYVGGILGRGEIRGETKGTNIEIDGVYTTSNIFNKTVYNENGDVRTGAIYGIIDGTVDNAYYLKSSLIVAKNTEDQSQYGVTAAGLKSNETFEALGGAENKWVRFVDTYPKLSIDGASNSQVLSEISFTNVKESYDITTEIGFNMAGLRSGGTITGTYNDKYISGSNVMFVETLNYGDDATNDIVITPDDGYEISSLTINGFDEPFIAEADGSYTIPASRFTDVNQNNHVIVVFTDKSYVLTINKFDNADNTPLEGVEFSIDQVEDRAVIGSEYGQKVDANNVNVPDYNSEVLGSTVFGTLTDAKGFGFVEENGKYVSTNRTQPGTDANSYVELDLSDKTGKYLVVVNAEQVGAGNTGYITVDQSTDIPSSFQHSISGTKAAADYSSDWLEAGNKYYIHFAFKHSTSNSSDAKLTINSISVYSRTDVALSGVTYPINLPTNASSKYNYRSINLPLSGKTGDYTVEVNAQVKGASKTGYYGFGIITPSTTTTCPAYNAPDSTTTRKVFSVAANANTIYKYQNLPGNANYKLWLGSYRASTSSASYGLTVNGVEVYKKELVTIPLGSLNNNAPRYNFIEDNGTYRPCDNRSSGYIAESYIPVDLTGLSGSYRIGLNATINNPNSNLYSYAVINDNTNTVGLNNVEGRFLYQQGSKNLTSDFISDVLTGGNMYYLHLGQYKGSNTADSYIINSVKLYNTESKSLQFTESIVDGVRSYTSNNQNYPNTTAATYIPIDLTNTYGKYNLRIKAEISSDTNDHGYIFVTESPDTPAITAQDGKLVDISGDVSETEYLKILNAGKTYYVHMLYNKDDCVNDGSDTFSINSLVLEYNTDDYYHEKHILTDANGKITRALGLGTYEIKETKALEDYEPVEAVTHRITLSSNNTVDIPNYHNKTITTHYVEYGNETHVLAPEEVQTLNSGDHYTTTPILEIEGYRLHKEDGEYVIPDNASGTVGDSDIDVYYYYDLIKYNYVINYYYDNVKDDTKTETGSEVPGTIVTYEDKLEDGYIFDRSVNAPMEISEYENENVIDVYYATILHITTDVIEHTENYYDGTSATGIKGGSISGEDEDPYETVQIGMTNTKSIVITPNSGYEIDKVYVNGNELDYSELIESGVVTIPEYYFKEMSEGKHITVRFKKVTDVRVKYLITGTEEALCSDVVIPGYAGDSFETQSKSFVGYKPASPAITNVDGDVIAANGTMTADEYTVIYWYDIDNSTILEKHILLEENNAETIIDSETHTAQVGTTITLNRNTYGYYEATQGPASQDEEVEVVSESANTYTATYESEVAKEVRFYYARKDAQVNVHYYDIETEDAIDNPVEVGGSALDNPTVMNGKAGKEYTTIAKELVGYNLDNRIDGSPNGIFDGIKNVIYYYREKVYTYQVNYYFDNVLDTSISVENTAKAGTVIRYEQQDRDGYVLDHVNKESITVTADESQNIINVYYVKGTFDYTVEYYYDNVKDDSMTETLSAVFESVIDTYPTEGKQKDGYTFSSVTGVPLTITSAPENNVIKVYYVKDNFGYSIEYYYDNVKDDSKTVTGTATFGEEIDTYTDKVIDGYKFQKVEGKPITITSTAANNVMKVYYVKDNFDYTVEYYYDNVKDDSKTVTGTATFGDEIDTYTDKVIDGYKFQKVEGKPITITSTAANNVMKVYYVKDNFGYSIEYYYDNVKDDSKTVTGTATFGEEIDTYTDKVIDGYKFQKVEGKPITITSTAANNVMKVYYVKDNFDYTVEYYYDNVKDDSKTDTFNATFGDVINTYTEKPVDGYEFSSVTGVPLTITSTPANNVIKVYYVKDNFGYSIEYYYDNVKDDTKTVTGTATFGDVISSYEDKVIDGYKFDHDEGKPLTITSTAANNVIKVYYVKDNFGYSVHYFYDNIEDIDAQVNESAEFGSVIDSYQDKVIDGYKFDHDEGKPLTITSNPANNVINVYYVKDNFNYTVEYYYDNVKDDTKTDTISAVFGSVINSYDNKVIDGYKFDHDEGKPLTITSTAANNVIKVYYVKDNFGYTVEYYYDDVKDDAMTETGSAVFGSVIDTVPTEGKQKDGYIFSNITGLPLKITSNPLNNIVKVYYIKDTFEYTVHYFYDNVEDEDKKESGSAVFEGVISTYPIEGKQKDGYKFDHDEGCPLTITSTPANNVINVYYVKDNFGYTVEYYYDNVKDDSKTVTGTATFGDVINTYDDKVIDGYKFDHDEGKPLTITSTVANNVIKVYYVKDNFDYTVEYYYDNVKDDSKTDTFNATFGDVINTYDEKPVDGYEFSSVTGVPLTITSTPANNVIKVYYTKDTFGYTVHYFYDNVEDEGKKESGSAVFGVVIDSYQDKVIDGYKFDHDEGAPLTITSNPANNVINVYYVKDNFDYTVEYYYDNVKDDSKTVTGSAEFGSVINSYDDKVIDGYKFDHDEGKPLTITSTAANNVIKVYYVKDNFGYSIEYYYDNVKDDSKTVTGTAIFGEKIDTYTDKVIDGYKFQKVEGKPIIITSTAANNVMKVYYVKDNFDYTVEYYYDNVKDDSKTVTGTATFGDEIDTYTDKVIDGYKFQKVEGKPITITSTAANNVMKVYYVKDNFGYSIEYYYDNVKDDSKTVTGTATFGEEIDTYTDKVIDGYKFQKVEGKPITITSTAANNVMKVYYVKDNFDYTVEYYYDNVKDDSKTVTGTATFGDVINSYDDKVIDGYKFDHDEGKPLTITSTVANNVIKVYYVKDNFDYTVEYYYDNVKDDSKTVTGTATFGDEIDTYTDKVIDGYKFQKVEGKPITITSTAANNVMKVYYVKDNFDYTVEYYYDNVKDDSKTDTFNATFGDVINSYDDKVIDGYKFDHDEGKPLTITSTVANNVIKVYYVKDNFGYTVEYYYDNVKDDSKTVTGTATFGDEIDTYTDKVIDGYKFQKVEGKPIIITSTAANNVMKVYYVKDNFDYTVEYYYDDVKDDSKTDTLNAEFGTVISTYTDKSGDRYDFVRDEGCPLTITSTPGNNVIKVYYVSVLNITTGVAEHTEHYTDGSTVTGAKGGTISGEGMNPYETVRKGITRPEDLDPVIIIPDEGYDVESVTVNGTPIDFSGMKTRGYRVIYPTDLLAAITEDTHIEATFRKVSSVKVKYMNKITNEALYKDGEDDFVLISGHEGDAYTTENKSFDGYRAVTPAITDKDGNAISGSGEMYADEYTVIYWYEKAEADVIEKHILVDEGTETILKEETHTGESWTNIVLNRIVDDRYEAADGTPVADEDIIVVDKTADTYSAQYTPEKVKEVRFYYNRKAAKVLVIFENSLTGEIIENPVDTHGNPVTNPTELIGKVGDAYDTSDTVVVLEGYRLDESKLPDNVTGEYKSNVQTVTYKYIKLKEYDIQVVYENEGTPIDDVKIKATSDSGVDLEDYPQGGKLKIDRVESTEEGKIIYTIVETETPEGFKTILDETNPGIVTVERVFNPETNRYEIKTETNGIDGLHVEVDDEAGTVTIYVEAEEIKPQPQPQPQPTPQPEPEPEPEVPEPIEPEPISIKTGDKILAYISVIGTAIVTIVVGLFTKKRKE